MESLEPQRIIPGLSGYASQPISPNEAIVENMEIERDGIWRPRLGLIEDTDLGYTVTHLSSVPSNFSARAICVANRVGKLYFGAGSTSDLTGTFPEGRIFEAWGEKSSDGTLYWMCHLASPYGSTNGSLVLVDKSGTQTTDGTTTGNALETYGLSVISLQGNASSARTTLSVSEIGDATTWPATYSAVTPSLVGSCARVLTIGDDRALLIGDTGLGSWGGSDADNFNQQDLLGIGLLPETWVKCGRRAIGLGHDRRVYIWEGQLSRIDMPIRDEMAGILRESIRTHYDPVKSHFILSDVTQGKSWVFDLDRNIWVTRLSFGTYGLAVYSPVTGYPPYTITYAAVGDRVSLYNYPEASRVYTDHGAAMTCLMETRPDHREMPEMAKQIQKVWVAGSGTWTVQLLHRDGPADSWTTLAADATVAAPGYVTFPMHSYRERKLKLTATAASGVRLQQVVVYEGVVNDGQ